MTVFLEHDHGWGQQRVAARGAHIARTQVGGNVGGLPLSVAGMRPSKTGCLSPSVRHGEIRVRPIKPVVPPLGTNHAATDDTANKEKR